MTMSSKSPATPIALTTDGYVALKEQPGVAVIDLWAPWCPPCRAMAPVVDELARAFSERATIAKLDIDDHPRVSEELGVASIPTLVFLKDGVEVDRLVGTATLGDLELRVQRILDES